MAEETQAPIFLPVPHPRVPELIRLERAKFEQLKELKEIEAECEAAAAPFALEIERIEAEQAAGAVAAESARAHRGDVLLAQEEHRRVQDRILEERAAQDARLKAESERLSAVLAEIDAADAERAESLGRLEADLGRARDGFDKARTTSRGRAIERKIGKISRQQETIVARNPGARWFRLEMCINAEAERLGLRAKVKAVVDAIASSRFIQEAGASIQQLRDELQAEPSDFEVRLRVLKILREMEVPTEDAAIEVVHGKRIGFNIKVLGLSEAARARCVVAAAGASANETGPDQTEAAAAATAA